MGELRLAVIWRLPLASIVTALKEMPSGRMNALAFTPPLVGLPQPAASH